MNREFSRQDYGERTAESVVEGGGSTRRGVAEPCREYEASLVALIRGEQ
jgi:hypothetical protein